MRSIRKVFWIILPITLISCAGAPQKEALSTEQCTLIGIVGGAAAGAGLGALGAGVFGAGAGLIIAINQCLVDDQPPLVVASVAPMDVDGDGIPDYLDRCPNTPFGVSVDSKGCSRDGDGDGIPDYLDRCLNTPFGVSVDSKGCSRDGDGDGVPDYRDRCPGTPYGVSVDGNGCPYDSDGDGAPDYLDRCSGTPAGALVRNNGCPYDSDGDGVFDGIDQCPDTPRGVEVTTNGCELEQEPIIAPSISYNINFAFDSTELSLAAIAILDQIVNKLNEFPELWIDIVGHTDSTGPAKYNQNLSLRRAVAARDHLIRRGINDNRIETEGRGESEPLASNDTKIGRTVNRRVELNTN